MNFKLYELDDGKFDICAFAGDTNEKISVSRGIAKAEQGYLNYRFDDDFLAELLIKSAEEYRNSDRMLKPEKGGFSYCVDSENMMIFEKWCVNAAENEMLKNAISKCRKLCVVLAAENGFSDGDVHGRLVYPKNVITREMHRFIGSNEYFKEIPASLCGAYLNIKRKEATESGRKDD